VEACTGLRKEAWSEVVDLAAYSLVCFKVCGLSCLVRYEARAWRTEGSPSCAVVLLVGRCLIGSPIVGGDKEVTIIWELELA
jgi:hypothetical protein